MPARTPGPSCSAPSPERTAIFAWLRVVATREAYRLSVIARPEARLGGLRPTDAGVGDTVDDPDVLDDALEAREALRALAALSVRQRTDLSLKIAGYSYEEIRTLTGGRTYTNVNKSLVKARAGIRRARTLGQ
jgi:DNA-directed RNA polymerase specialized sigma24 family protein